MAAPGTLAHINPDDLIERIADGAIPSRLAKELGVTKAAVYYHLSDRPDYQKARKIGMWARLDDAEIAVREADDQLSLSRAREVFRATSWRAEREHSDTWGAQANVSVTINIANDIQSISERLQASAAQSSIEGESERVED